MPPIKSRGDMAPGAWMTGFYTGNTYLENSVLKYFENRFLKILKGKMIMKSKLVAQYNDGVKKGLYKKIEPIHFVTNILSLIVFPFISSPIIIKMQKLGKNDFIEMMNKRKKLIPKWIIQMIKK